MGRDTLRDCNYLSNKSKINRVHKNNATSPHILNPYQQSTQYSKYIHHPISIKQQQSLIQFLQRYGPFPNTHQYNKNCEHAKNILLASLTPLIIKVVNHYKKWCCHGISAQDLFQAGLHGVLLATKTYNPNVMGKDDKPLMFIWYALMRIKQRCRKEIRKTFLHFSQELYDILPKYMKFIFDYSCTHDTKPSQLEIAAGTGLSINKIKYLQLSMVKVESYLDLKSKSSVLNKTYHDETLEQIEFNELLRINMQHMPDRKQLVANAIFNEPGRTNMAKIAKELGISRERVRQINKEITTELKYKLQHLFN